MNELKQEAIKKAYGEYWEQVKDYVDDYGFTSIDSLIEIGTNIEKYIDCEVDDYEYPQAYRPKSLQGIENNNGWIIIESENDLPKEILECFFISNGCTYLGYFANRNNGVFCVDGDDVNKNEVSHYKLIQKPNPPIY